MRKTQVHGRADGGDHPGGGSRSVAAVAKRHGVSEQTIYGWRSGLAGFRRTTFAA